MERVSLALISLAYTKVPDNRREAATFRLDKGHAIAAVADMEDVPVLTASIRHETLKFRHFRGHSDRMSNEVQRFFSHRILAH